MACSRSSRVFLSRRRAASTGSSALATSAWTRPGGGVVGAGRLAFRPGGEGEGLLSGEVEHGGVVEQALVDRAEFLDVERGVVDAAERAAFVRDEGEGGDGSEEVAVGELPALEQFGSEEFAVEDGEVEQGGQGTTIGEAVAAAQELEEGQEASPEVSVVVGGAGFEGEPTQPFDGVALPVEVVAAQEPTLFGHQEEEEAVDQPEQELVVGGGGELASGDLLAQRAVGRVAEEAVAERVEGLLHTVAQAVAGAGPLLASLLVVLLQEAVLGIGDPGRQAGAVEQAVEEDEVGEALAGEDGGEVELEIGLGAQVGGGAEETEDEAIGDDPPEMVGAVEELLDEGVRGEAGATGGIDAAEFLAGTGDVEGRGVLLGAGAVGDGVGAALQVVGAGIAFHVVAELRQEGDDPEIAGDGGGAVAGVEALEAALEHAPEVEGIAVGLSQVVAERALVGEAEVAGALTGQRGGIAAQGLEEVGGEEGADEADGAGARVGDGGKGRSNGERHGSSSPAAAASRAMVSSGWLYQSRFAEGRGQAVTYPPARQGRQSPGGAMGAVPGGAATWSMRATVVAAPMARAGEAAPRPYTGGAEHPRCGLCLHGWAVRDSPCCRGQAVPDPPARQGRLRVAPIGAGCRPARRISCRGFAAPVRGGRGSASPLKGAVRRPGARSAIRGHDGGTAVRWGQAVPDPPAREGRQSPGGRWAGAG
jgi:hypothetical protein